MKPSYEDDLEFEETNDELSDLAKDFLKAARELDTLVNTPPEKDLDKKIEEFRERLKEAFEAVEEEAEEITMSPTPVVGVFDGHSIYQAVDARAQGIIEGYNLGLSRK